VSEGSNTEAEEVTGFAVRVLVPATRAHQPVAARGRVLHCALPLSLWGGLDPTTGEVIDRRHPQSGQILTGRVVFLPIGRGSSSASSILLEAAKRGTAPAAFVLREVDGILALGAAVAQQLYGEAPAVVVLDAESWQIAAQWREVSIEPGPRTAFGRLTCVASVD
jgi:predicted aconitase with swiveling domain